MLISNEPLTNLKAGSLDLRVTETNPRTDPRWESFLLDHPNGSIYHHPAWLEALEREYGQKGVYFLCENAGGQVLAILPMIHTRGLPFGLGRPLAGRRLSSLPRTPLAGPLSIDPRATVALLQTAVQRASRKPAIQLQIKTQGRELDELIDGVVCMPWRLSYLLKLPSSSDGLFASGTATPELLSIGRSTGLKSSACKFVQRKQRMSSAPGIGSTWTRCAAMQSCLGLTGSLRRFGNC
jgi:hypothetical protein